MKQFIGFLFLFVSSILSFVQINMFSRNDFAENYRLFILAGITFGSLIASTLALSIEKNNKVRKYAASISAITCIVLIIAIAVFVFSESNKISPLEYGIFIFYSIMYCIYTFSGFSQPKQIDKNG